MNTPPLSFTIDDGVVIEIDTEHDDTTQPNDKISTTRHVRIEKAETEHVSS